MFNSYVFNNGLTFLSIPKKDSFSTTILILVKTGSFYENKGNNGISHFLEHLAFKGTEKRKTPLEISSEFDSLGAKYNAFTSYEFTGFWVKVQNEHISQALDLIADIYLNPIFNPKEIEKEKGVIIGELNMYNDFPDYKVQDMFSSLLYGDQPAGWKIVGTKENIQKFKAEDFIKYRSKHYLSSQTILAVAGETKSLNWQKEINYYFGSFKKGKKTIQPAVKKYKSSPLALEYKETDQTHLVLGAKTCSRFSLYRYPLNVLSTILGGMMSSRLFQQIREKLGAGYYIHSYNDFFKDHGYFSISAGINNSKVEKSILVILKEIEKIKKYNIPLKELKKAKDHIIGGLYLSLESSDQWASFYGLQKVKGERVKTPSEIAEKIKNVSSSQIREAANKFFKKENFHLALIGPFKDKEKFIKLLGR